MSDELADARDALLKATAGLDAEIRKNGRSNIILFFTLFMMFAGVVILAAIRM